MTQLLLIGFLILVLFGGLRLRPQARARAATGLSKLRRRAGSFLAGDSPAEQAKAEAAADLVPCPQCGAYIAENARGCGRPDCPQAR